MKPLYATLLKVLVFSLAATTIGCRDERDVKQFTPPNVRKVPRPPRDSDAPPADPLMIGHPIDSEETPELVTSVVVNAGCEGDVPSMAVAKGHAEPALCEHIIMTAVVETDDDAYEYGAPFIWAIGDPGVATLDCLNGEHDNFCWPVGQKDIFDQSTFSEPTTLVLGCAKNNCPPMSDICEDLVCRSVAVASVINLEGPWTLKSTILEGDLALTIAQDGRRMTAANLNLKHGLVQKMSVSFELDDVLYKGGIGIDRAHMSGEIYDLLTLNYIGEWSAARAP